MPRIVRALLGLGAAFALPLPLVAATVPAAADEAVDPDQARVDQAAVLIDQQRAAEAVPILEAVIAGKEANHAGEARRIYCARTPAETLVYLAQAAEGKRSAIALGPTWAQAVFLKGFALIDLRRAEEARGFLERAVELSPGNSHYLGELAEWHKSKGEWDEALRLFQQATAAATISPEGLKDFDEGRGVRGVGFVLIEQGKLDEAEAIFAARLAKVPGDTKAQNELRYIRQQRAKRATAPVT